MEKQENRMMSSACIRIRRHPPHCTIATILFVTACLTWITMSTLLGEGDVTETGKPCRHNMRTSAHEYSASVDLRIIVITFNRPRSLRTLLTSLDHLQTDGATVALDIWIDVDGEGAVPEDTVAVATNYNFPGGQKTVHIQPHCMGIFGQWVNTWRPKVNTSELALILEDDITLSPYSWRWLKLAHARYKDWARVAGYTLQCQNVKTFMGYSVDLPVPDDASIFGYRVLGTWGFAPHPEKWRQFQDWVFKVKPDGFFKPYVDGIIPNKWFKNFETSSREQSMWEMWHICFTHFNNLLTIYPNLRTQSADGAVSPYGRCLAVNRKEPGLHFSGHTALGSEEVQRQILTTWSKKFEDLPGVPDLPDHLPGHELSGDVIKIFHYNGDLM